MTINPDWNAVAELEEVLPANDNIKGNILEMFGDVYGVNNDTYRLVSGFLDGIFSKNAKAFLKFFEYNLDDIFSALNENLGAHSIKSSFERIYPNNHTKLEKIILSRAEEFSREVAFLMSENVTFQNMYAYFETAALELDTRYKFERIFESENDSFIVHEKFRRPLSVLEKSEKFQDQDLFKQDGCESAEDLVNLANANKAEFEQILDFVSLKSYSRVISGVKKEKRIEEKVQSECDGDFNKIKDALRGYLIFNNKVDLLYGLNLLEADTRVKNIYFEERMDIEKLEDITDINRVKCQSDVKVVFTLNSGFVCEIQLHFKETHDAKENGILLDEKILDPEWAGIDEENYAQYSKHGINYDKDTLTDGFTPFEVGIINELGDELPKFGDIVNTHSIYSIARKICPENKIDYILELPNHLQILYIKLKDLESRIASMPLKNLETNINQEVAGYLPDLRNKEATV